MYRGGIGQLDAVSIFSFINHFSAIKTHENLIFIHGPHNTQIPVIHPFFIVVPFLHDLIAGEEMRSALQWMTVDQLLNSMVQMVHAAGAPVHG